MSMDAPHVKNRLKIIETNNASVPLSEMSFLLYYKRMFISLQSQFFLIFDLDKNWRTDEVSSKMSCQNITWQWQNKMEETNPKVCTQLSFRLISISPPTFHWTSSWIRNKINFNIYDWGLPIISGLKLFDIEDITN